MKIVAVFSNDKLGLPALIVANVADDVGLMTMVWGGCSHPTCPAFSSAERGMMIFSAVKAREFNLTIPEQMFPAQTSTAAFFSGHELEPFVYAQASAAPRGMVFPIIGAGIPFLGCFWFGCLFAFWFCGN